MKNIQLVSLLATFLLSACAANPARTPSSVEPDSQSVELATKLRGGAVKFRAYRNGDQVSVLGFLELKFKGCEAKVNTENNTPGFLGGDFQGSYVDCETDLASDPVHGSIHSYLKGDKRKFKARVVMEKTNEYSLDVDVDLVWENKRWNGTGKVTGWLNEGGRDVHVTATVRETLSF